MKVASQQQFTIKRLLKKMINMAPGNMSYSWSLRLMLVLLLTGCGEAGKQAPAVAEKNASTTGIQWFAGTVEEAFAHAETVNKPVFLYWGADWCPPCNQLKATVFEQREFIEQSRLFIPVYLDGDTPRAQQIGEQLGVMGYPTVIVFNPSGEELTRIPGGINLDHYLRVLALSLEHLRPAAALVAAAVSGERLSQDDCQLLAWYSWAQDNGRTLAGRDPLAVFTRLLEICGDTSAVVNSRLGMAALNAWLMVDHSEEALRSATGEYQLLVETVLDDRELSIANIEPIIYQAGDIVGALTAPGAERETLRQRWLSRLQSLSADPQVALADRLATLYGELQLARLSHSFDGYGPELITRVQQQVVWADKHATTSFERHVVISVAWDVLYEAGLERQAGDLLLAEMEKSQSPYYFMLELANIAEKAGREDEALAWLERAWHAATGSATRFQWGVNYLQGLLKMSPEDTQRIEATGVAVLSELAQQDAPLFQRNRQRLEKLGTALVEWNEFFEQPAVLAAFRAQLMPLCETDATASSTTTFCREYLVTE